MKTRVGKAANQHPYPAVCLIHHDEHCPEYSKAIDFYSIDECRGWLQKQLAYLDELETPR